MFTFDELQEKALAQLKTDWNDLQKTIEKSKINEKLANAIMKLRSLSEDAKFILADSICGQEQSFLNDFHVILNGDEHLKLPEALHDLIHLLNYNIVDDGFLRLGRITLKKHYLEDDVEIEHQYFLYSNEAVSPDELAKSLIEKDSTSFLHPEFVSVETASFKEDIGRFIKFLEIITKKKNWKGFDFLGDAELYDNLFKNE